MKKTILTFLLIAVSTQAFGAAFDRMGGGVRAKGLGDAFVALADDPSAVYWNQAGISQMTKRSLLTNYHDVFNLGLLNYGEFFYIQPGIWKGGLGFGYRHMSTSKEVEFLDYTEQTFTIAYGCEPWKNVRLGTALKYYDVEYDVAANGYGIDASALYSFFDYFSVGMLIQDAIEPEIEWESDAIDRLPFNLRLGAAFKWEDILNVAVDVDKIVNDDDDPEVHVGIEYWLPKKYLGFRVGGVQQRSGAWSGSMGFGVRYELFNMDYTYENHYLLPGSHYFSVGLEF